MITKEQLAKWRSEGFEFDDFYDEVAVEKKEKNIDEINTFGFLPIVSTNLSQEPKNAFLYPRNCESLQKKTLNLGESYIPQYREYAIPEIIISKNLISRIPILVKGEYNPLTFQYEDCKLFFSCSQSNVKLSFINSDNTNYELGISKYDLNSVKYGDEFVMEIDSKNLKWGSKFTITIYTDSSYSQFSNRGSGGKKICGMISVTIADKDVFLEEDIQRTLNMMRLVSENINTQPKAGEYRATRNYCVFATDRYTGALLNNTSQFYTYDDKSGKVTNSESLLSGTTRAKKIKKDGYISTYIIYGNNDLIYPIDENIAKIKDDLIYNAVGIKKGKLKEFFNNTIKNRIGYHYYYTTYTDDFHVQILIIDYRNPCNATYKIIDQHGETSSKGKLSEIDEGFIRQSSWTFSNFYINKDKKYYPKTTTSLWKIQR